MFFVNPKHLIFMGDNPKLRQKAAKLGKDGLGAGCVLIKFPGATSSHCQALERLSARADSTTLPGGWKMLLEEDNVSEKTRAELPECSGQTNGPDRMPIPSSDRPPAEIPQCDRTGPPTPRARSRSLVIWVLVAILLGLGGMLHETELQAERYRLAAQDARARADDLVNFMLSDLRDQLEPLGHVAVLEQPARKALAYLESLRDPLGEAPDTLRSRSIALENIGDVLLVKGDHAGARSAYEKALEIATQLSNRNPADAKLRHDLALSHARIGDIREDQGDPPGALGAYRSALDIMEQIARQYPDNNQWQRDVGISHERVGNVLRATGNVPEALAHYEARQAVHSRLAALDPSNALWQRDLALSYGALGDVHMLQGELAKASADYLKCLAIMNQLGLQEPANTEWQHDIGVSQEKIGDVNAARGDLADARAAYQRALEKAERLARQDPANIQWQRDLAARYQRIGAVRQAQGELSEAIAMQNRASELFETLADKFGTPQAQAEAADAWGRLAWYELFQRQPERAVEAARKGLKADPSQLRIKTYLAHGLLLTGHYADADKIYRENRSATLDGGRPFAQAVLDDFKQLWIKGIVHPDMIGIEAWLKSSHSNR